MTAATTKCGVLWGVGACATGRCDGGFLATPPCCKKADKAVLVRMSQSWRDSLCESHMSQSQKELREMFFVSMYGSYLLFFQYPICVSVLTLVLGGVMLAPDF